jgi:tetratricopeptide (TPR) repeat protein
MRKNLVIFISLLTLVSCGFWTNFTTYFNTYYNAERLISESEKEFEYQDEKTRGIEPRTFVPKYNIIKEDSDNYDDVPSFMNEFIISKTKLQPVRVKLDSVLIKGSKILAKKSESNFIEGTLYLMAQAYFYRSEWLPCEVKCGELIDIYPTGKKSPDAHLLMAKSLLIQKKFDYGKKVLSRTVDIAWQLERYDILSEAFRLQADLAIYQNDSEGALRPYKQAVAQTSDKTLKARWQLDLAALLYSLRQFERAEKAFEKVYEDYSPEYVQTFEAKLYRSISLSKLGRYWEADKILTDLESDGKWEEWIDYSKVGRLFLVKEKLKDTLDLTVDKYALDSMETYADTAMTGQKLLMAYQYDKGVDYYNESNYVQAKLYIDKSRRRRTEVFDEATQINKYLGQLLHNSSKGAGYFGKEKDFTKYNPTQFDKAAVSAFAIARVFDKFGKDDSTGYYYEQAAYLSSDTDPLKPKYLWAYSQFIREMDPDQENREMQLKADSLLQIIVDNYQTTEYYTESAKLLRLTNAYRIDEAKELYSSGVDHRKYENYDFAIAQFLKCVANHPKSEYAPKSLYQAGWIFENYQRRPDSAMKYYRILVDEYPNSIYAEDIVVSLAYLESVLVGSDVPDSIATDMKKRQLNLILSEEQINNNLPMPKIIQQPEENKGFFEKAKDFLRKQIGSAVDSNYNRLNDKIEKVQSIDPSKLQDIKVEDLKNFDPNDINSLTPADSSSLNNEIELPPITQDTLGSSLGNPKK